MLFPCVGVEVKEVLNVLYFSHIYLSFTDIKTGVPVGFMWGPQQNEE